MPQKVLPGHPTKRRNPQTRTTRKHPASEHKESTVTGGHRLALLSIAARRRCFTLEWRQLTVAATQ